MKEEFFNDFDRVVAPSSLAVVDALVEFDMVPLGILLRNTSTPLMYTTAPSSRFIPILNDEYNFGFAIVMLVRK